MNTQITILAFYGLGYELKYYVIFDHSVYCITKDTNFTTITHHFPLFFHKFFLVNSILTLNAMGGRV